MSGPKRTARDPKTLRNRNLLDAAVAMMEAHGFQVLTAGPIRVQKVEKIASRYVMTIYMTALDKKPNPKLLQ